MCGLAGLILGEKRRRTDEREQLAWLFSVLLVMSERRGPHATGIAWLNREGEHGLFKRPLPARRFVRDKAFAEILAEIDNRTTLLLGHTRWRTRGDERVNENNHPIRAYASDPAYLDAALVEEQGWQELAVPPMSLIRFRHRNMTDFSIEPFEFIARAMPRSTAMEECGDL